MFFKKKKDDEHLDMEILEDIKEPFSLHNFIEDEIVTRYKKFKQMLDDRGILFFLISPFQYRSRLLIKIWVLVVCVIVGVVPRGASLIAQTKERNAQSEMASISGSIYQPGKLRVIPLASSQYEKQHVLAFNLTGNTSDGVPSTNDKYTVELKGLRGAVDTQAIEYSYNVIPISNSERLMIVYIDNREQNDETGIYNLFIEITGDELPRDKRRPMEIVLSNVQETTTLFNEEGIDLAILTDGMSQISNDIETSVATLESAMASYTLMDDRLNSIGMKPEMSAEDLQKHVEKESFLTDIEDTSSVRDIPRDAKLAVDDDGTGRPNDPSIVARISYDGVMYSSKDEMPSEVKRELDDLQRQTSAVTEAVKRLNASRRDKFNDLVGLSATLNKAIALDNFTELKNVE